MTIWGDGPDVRYLRTRGAEGEPMGCGGTCPICRPYAAEQEVRRRGFPVRPRPAESSDTRPQKDPRSARLPP